jgi:prophage antirepressor-like protein
MSLTSIKDIFNYENKKMRVYGTVDNPWFCGKDVCSILEYKNIKKALQTHVPEKYKMNYKDLYEKINSGTQDGFHQKVKYNDGKIIYINEAGLYELIFNSKMEICHRTSYQLWVLLS